MTFCKRQGGNIKKGNSFIGGGQMSLLIFNIKVKVDKPHKLVLFWAYEKKKRKKKETLFYG